MGKCSGVVGGFCLSQELGSHPMLGIGVGQENQAEINRPL